MKAQSLELVEEQLNLKTCCECDTVYFCKFLLYSYGNKRIFSTLVRMIYIMVPDLIDGHNMVKVTFRRVFIFNLKAHCYCFIVLIFPLNFCKSRLMLVFQIKWNIHSLYL